MTRLVDQLEKRGWVRRDAGAGDARQRLVTLTAKGAKVGREIGSLIAAALEDPQ